MRIPTFGPFRPSSFSQGWFVSAGLIYALMPKLNFLSCLAIAACLTPTDPILAAAVVGGKYAEKHVPVHIRHLLAAECGCNDGAAFPFLFIALYLTTNETVGDAIAEWFLDLWLCKLLPFHDIPCAHLCCLFLPSIHQIRSCFLSFMVPSSASLSDTS